jgi:acetylornithine deacetylase/succinyl-diaminopimelate desuccinylase-like protein
VNATLERVRARVAERFPADLERIRDYLRLPSVSATGEGIRCKGLCSLELVAEAGDWGGPAIDLHSSEQAWIASPVWALVHALGTLTDADERIRVPGLDGERGPSDGDARLLAELAETFDPQEHLREAHAARYRLPGGAAERLEALLYRPTLNVSGIAGGYVGLGGKTIVPSRAVAMVDIRLVPDGDPESAAGAHGPDEYATLAGLQEHVVGAAAFLLAYASGTAEAPA